MNTLAQRLKYARELANLSQQEVAKRAGISQPTYFKIENGSTLKPRNILEISHALNVDAHWLATGEGEISAEKPTIEQLRQKIKLVENRKSEVKPSNFLSMANPVPIISWVAAGSWSSSETVEWLDDDIEYLPRPANLSADGFCLRVRGVSMLPEFKPNEVIFVEPNFGVWDLKNGDLVVVRENGNHEATFKQLIMGETSDDIYLKPLNPDWHEQRMTPKSEWELVGKVVGKWVKY